MNQWLLIGLNDEEAKAILELLNDNDMLRAEREKALFLRCFSSGFCELQIAKIYCDLF